MSSTNLVDKMTNRYSRDALTYLPAILIPAIMNVLSVMIFTRLFSTADFGLYNLVLTTTQLLSMVMSQWIMQSIQYYRPKYVHNNMISYFNANLYQMLILVSVIIIAFSILIYFIINLFFNHMPIERFSTIFWISVFLVILQGLLKIGLVLFQSELKVNKFRYYQLINSIIKFGMSLILIFFVFKDIISIFIGTIISIILIIYPIFKETGIIQSKNTIKYLNQNFKDFFKDFFKYGFPMIGWFLGTSLLNLVDKYMIGYYRGNIEVGIYSANTSIVFFGVGLLSGPLLNAAHPIIMNAVSENGINKEVFQSTISNFSRLFLLTMMPLAFFISIFRVEIATVLLGEDYRSGAFIIPIILFGFLIWHFSLYGHKVHEIHGKTKQMVWYVVVAVIVNIAFNILLIPKYGYIGASIATFLGYIAYPIAIYISSYKLILWRIPWKSLFKILLASILSALLTIQTIDVTNLHNLYFVLIVGFVCFIILYIVLITVLKEFSKNEMDKLYKPLKKLLNK
ncbi:oligosaccharide flippase family protein [Niallia sp. Marseille-Q9988]